MHEEKPPEECQALIDEGWAYLDVRTPEEFSGGHAPGAVNVPFALIGPGGMMPNPLFLGVARRLFTTDQGLVVGGASGHRSDRACQMLAQMGYGRLVNMRGGFSGDQDENGQVVDPGWSQCGLPTTQGRDEGSWDAVQQRVRG